MDNEGRVRGKNYEPSTASEIVTVVDSLNAVFSSKRDPATLITHLSLDQTAIDDAKSLNSLVQTTKQITSNITYDTQKQVAEYFTLKTNTLVTEKRTLLSNLHNVQASLTFQFSVKKASNFQ